MTWYMYNVYINNIVWNSSCKTLDTSCICATTENMIKLKDNKAKWNIKKVSGINEKEKGTLEEFFLKKTIPIVSII